MNYKSKKFLLVAVAIVLVMATVALIVLRSRKLDSAPRASDSTTAEKIENLKKNAEAIVMLKAKCGLETKVENEAACECDADRRINMNVDEVEALVMEDSSIAAAEIELANGQKVKVQSLIDSRRPVTPECSGQ